METITSPTYNVYVCVVCGEVPVSRFENPCHRSVERLTVSYETDKIVSRLTHRNPTPAPAPDSSERAYLHKKYGSWGKFNKYASHTRRISAKGDQ